MIKRLKYQTKSYFKLLFLILKKLKLSSFFSLLLLATFVNTRALNADLILDDKVPVIYENPLMGLSEKLGLQYHRDSNVLQLPVC